MKIIIPYEKLVNYIYIYKIIIYKKYFVKHAKKNTFFSHYLK